MSKLGVLTIAIGLDEANRLWDAGGVHDYSRIGSPVRYGYVDVKFNGQGRMKVINVETMSDILLQIHNVAVDLYPDDRAARQAYRRSAYRAMCLAHFTATQQMDFIVLLDEPLAPPTIANAIAGYDGSGRAYDLFLHRPNLDIATDDGISFVFDSRRPETPLAIVTALRLYQTGAAASLPSTLFDYVLSCAFAAAGSVARSEQPALTARLWNAARVPSVQAA